MLVRGPGRGGEKWSDEHPQSTEKRCHRHVLMQWSQISWSPIRSARSRDRRGLPPSLQNADRRDSRPNPNSMGPSPDRHSGDPVASKPHTQGHATLTGSNRSQAPCGPRSQNNGANPRCKCAGRNRRRPPRERSTRPRSQERGQGAAVARKKKRWRPPTMQSSGGTPAFVGYRIYGQGSTTRGRERSKLGRRGRKGESRNKQARSYICVRIGPGDAPHAEGTWARLKPNPERGSQGVHKNDAEGRGPEGPARSATPARNQWRYARTS